MITYEDCISHFWSVDRISHEQKAYGPALRHIAEIIEKGVRSHPELSVGSNTDGMDVRSVGNSSVLKETCLVEAFNLKVSRPLQ